MRISIVGPVYPYRGGIAHHTALLARHLAEQHAVQVISFSQQYPRWLVHGRTDRDPSHRPLQTTAAYLLDPLNPLTWWRVARRVRAWGADLVILPWWVTFWAPAWFVLAGLIHRGSRARVLYLCHNALPHEGRALDRWLARAALAQGDLFLAQCEEQAQLLRSLVPGRPVAWTVMPSYAEVGSAPGAPRPDPAARAGLGLAEGQPVLLFFGFVRPYKGLGVLLDAMPAVLAGLPAAHLLVVGEIWGGKEDYLAQIARLGLAQHVTLVDRYVPDEELGRYFAAADVAVLPYLSATQSAVVALAHGFGLPVIATRVGGLPDAVLDGQTGLLVPPGDAPALAAAINRFYREELGPAMRDNVRRDRSRFDWQHMVAAIEALTGQTGPAYTKERPQESVCPRI